MDNIAQIPVSSAPNFLLSVLMDLNETYFSIFSLAKRAKLNIINIFGAKMFLPASC